jgi:hypothetical protein
MKRTIDSHSVCPRPIGRVYCRDYDDFAACRLERVMSGLMMD